MPPALPPRTKRGSIKEKHFSPGSSPTAISALSVYLATVGRNDSAIRKCLITIRPLSLHFVAKQPFLSWHPKDRRINEIKSVTISRALNPHWKHRRRFTEQGNIPDFDSLDWPSRRSSMKGSIRYFVGVKSCNCKVCIAHLSKEIESLT